MKKSVAICCAKTVVMLLVLSGTCCTKRDSKPGTVTQSSKASLEMPTVVATIAQDDRPPKVPPSHDGDPDAPAAFQVFFSESGKGVAYVVAKDRKVSVIHNQNRGKEYTAVKAIVLSPDGSRIAYPAVVDNGKSCMVVDGKEGKAFDGVLTPIFSPDSQHVIYQAKEGNKWYLVVDNLQNAGTVSSYTTPEFSEDSKSIVYVEAAASSSEMKLIVSDLIFSKQVVKTSIGDQLFTTNRSRTRIAAVQVVDNKLRVIDFSFAKPESVREGALYDLIERLVVADDGESVAYCALKNGKRLVVLNSKEETLPKGLLPELPVVRPDNKGVGLLLGFEKKISLHQSFYNSSEKGQKYDEADGLIYSKSGRFLAYAAARGESWFIVANGQEGPAFDRVVTPQFSPDEQFLVYRARKDGKRFVVVADTNGKTIKKHPAYEQVFDVHFTADGKSVAYGVKDGNQLVWRVEKL